MTAWKVRGFFLHLEIGGGILDNRLQELESQVQKLTERVWALEQIIVPSQRQNEEERAIDKDPFPERRNIEEEGEFLQNHLSEKSKISNGLPRLKELVPKRESASGGLSEEKLAGTLFNRLGILAIMLAVGFFLKWSFDNHIIGELGRVVIGILLGLGFLGAGEIFQRRKYKIYGQGFTGGGIAILYFSIYSAFAFYNLISQPVAFGMMILITVAASLLAIRYDSRAVGILGIVGGFATPFILSDGSSNRAALLTYIAILNIGVIGVAFYKKWPVFNYLTFLFTYLTYTISHLFYTSKEFPTVSFVYLSLYFLMYLGVSLGRNVRLKEKANWADLGLVFTNAGVFFALSYNLLENFWVGYMGYWATLLGIVYILLGKSIYKYHQGDRNLALTFIGIAGGFITLALPLQLTTYWLSIAWALEALIILALSFQMEEIKVRITGFAVLGLSIIRLVNEPFHITGKEKWILFPSASIAYLGVLIILVGVLLLYYRLKKTPWDQKTFFGLVILFNLILLLFLTQEISAYFDYRRMLYMGQDKLNVRALRNAEDVTLSLVWGVHAGILIILGFWRRIKGIRWFGLAFLGVVIFKVFLYDLSNLSTPYRILSFIVLGVILLGVSWLYQRYKHLILGEMTSEKTQG